MTQTKKLGLMERLAAGPVICAEGYLFEFERRGYLQAGAFVPEVVLEHPEMVAGLHREFVHAGSDVVEAFTYYAHREKLRLIGRESDLQTMNRQALRIAKEVATETAALVAGNICNTNIYDPGDAASARAAQEMFEEQVGWAAEAGIDMIVAETFSYAKEALVALKAAKAAGVPVVVTLAMHRSDLTREDWTVSDACKRLEDAGASVVGLNCIRGPRSMMPLLKKIRSAIKGPMAALPVPYRTNEQEPTFQSLRDHGYEKFPAGRPFPTGLDPFTCNRYEIADFARDAFALGISYLGVCCGAGPHHIRSMAEALGRQPPASRFSADMSKHAFLGTDKTLKQVNRDFAAKL
ncbi:MAG: homocysteine S-methyltransferase family protein [Proteobacteria bacterium]|nr:homocysteine S-methyltransferase family protein [Pseudomonadota bacterium]MBI3496652.1 homocysteine S-methyltransferase family protein [Pseudomonadota bacterium]